MSNDYKYYPALSNLMRIDDLPNFLNFLKEQIQEFFDKIYYKNYCGSRNVTGSSAFHRLDIVPRARLALELFGSGFSLVLNPDYEDSTISSFPITLFWQWEILRYVRNFNPQTFSYSPEAFFELAIDILGISKEQILETAVNTFVVPTGINSPFGQLVSDISALYGNITVDENAEDRYEQLAEQIEALNQNVFFTIFGLYLLSSTGSLSETMQKLKNFFNPFFNRDFEAYIKDLLTPKISASLNDISLALAFPHTWLKPLDSEGNVIEDENVKSMLRFNVGALRFSTENGFTFENESSLEFTKSEIGNTGLTLDFDQMKFDFSTTSNLPEATAAGYPDDFRGVFIQEAEIGLPKKWFGDSGTQLSLVGRNLLIGTGGFSGTVGLETTNTMWANLGGGDGFNSFHY